MFKKNLFFFDLYNQNSSLILFVNRLKDKNLFSKFTVLFKLIFLSSLFLFLLLKFIYSLFQFILLVDLIEVKIKEFILLCSLFKLLYYYHYPL